VRKLIVLAVAVLASLVAASLAFAAASTTLEVKASPNKASKSKKKLRPMTLEINVSFADPTVPQPPPLKKVVIRLQRGGVYNGKLFPKCDKGRLETKGEKACPKGSLIGKGTATASAKPIVDLVNAKISVYNGPTKGGNPTVLLYSIPDISGPITVEGRVEKKASSCANGQGRCDYQLVFDVPDIPTLPNAPPASVLTVKTKTLKTFVKKKKRVKGKKRTVKIPLIGAPTECKGKWVADSTVDFANGERATAVVSTPCKK
jgi:hypothetical protein